MAEVVVVVGAAVAPDGVRSENKLDSWSRTDMAADGVDELYAGRTLVHGVLMALSRRLVKMTQYGDFIPRSGARLPEMLRLKGLADICFGSDFLRLDDAR